MGWIAKPLAAVLVFACFSLSIAQRSASGYGQGGQGMGGGGMGGGLFRGTYAGDTHVIAPGNGSGDASIPDPDAQDGKPDDQNLSGLWDKKTAILTPGDHVEYKYRLAKGETIFASATSDAFDPAAAILDEKGKVLAQNDDRAEGDQSPFVTYRVAEAGTYIVRIYSVRSVSGGKFLAKVCHFVPADAVLGPHTYERVPRLDTPNGPLFVFCLKAKKNKLYDLSTVEEVSDRSTSGISLYRIIGPTGVSAIDYTVLEPSAVFQACADGDYYLEYSGREDRRVRTKFKEFDAIPVTTNGEFKKQLEFREWAVFEMPVKKGEFVRSTLTGITLYSSELGPIPPADSHNNSGSRGVWVGFPTNIDTPDDVIRVFQFDGVLITKVCNMSGKTDTMTLKNTPSVPEWTEGSLGRQHLKVGDSRVFQLDASKSELMKVMVRSKEFSPELQIYDMQGNLLNVLNNRKTLTASDDLYFPDPGKFIIRVLCEGNGGAGDFEMKRDSVASAPYKLGGLETLKLTGANFGLYTVNLEAGKRYQLTTDQPDVPLSADLLDPDGDFLISQRITFDKIQQQYFVPARSGPHRLWLRGEPGNRLFKFELHVAPTLGGSQ